MTRAAVLVHVQHLLGIGHFMRAREVAGALARRFDVHLVSGGMPVALPPPSGVRVVQLPPVRVDDWTFRPLRDASGAPIDDAYRARRRDVLLEALDAARPAAVITETFPFGRRALRFELVPLVERIASSARKPLLLASVRDILQRHDEKREREMLDVAHAHYDAVLVHADPRFARFEQSFSPEAPLDRAPPIHYTGFVTAGRPVAAGASRREGIVVSAGGGAVGAALVAAALGARPRSRFRTHAWRVLVGQNVPDAEFEAIARCAGEGLTVERARRDFRALLARARVSVSQAGYNTVLDVLCSGAAAVLVPFRAGGQTEQPARAARLASLGLADVVDEAALDADTLASAIDAAGERGGAAFDFDVDGANRSAAIVSRLVDARDAAGARTT